MAYFRKRGKYWSFSLYVPTPDGGKRQKEFGGYATKGAAKDASIKIEKELLDGIYVLPSDITFTEYSNNHWLPAYKKMVKPSSAYIRGYRLKVLCKFFGEMEVQKITPAVYSNAMLLVYDKYARNTANMIHNTAKMIFRKAFNDELLNKNPAERFLTPRHLMTLEQAQEKARIKYMQKNELANFLRIAKEHGIGDDYLFFKVLAYTGMRVGELCALKWADVCFAKPEISINKTLFAPSTKTQKYELLPPKTKSSNRVIDIDKALADELKRHKKIQHSTRMLCGASWHADFVFINELTAGLPKSPKTIQNHMLRLMGIMGVEQPLSPHSLRHTHCSLLAEAGASLEEIQARLGHSNDVITKTIYLHITDARKKDTAAKFSELMAKISQ